MKIRITGHDGEGVFPFGNSGPWSDFKNEFLKAGHQICDSSYTEDADAIISNSYNSNISNFLDRSKIPLNKRILVLWEPYIVEKIRYSETVLSKFGTVFAPSIDWAERTDSIPFNWPQEKISLKNYSIPWNGRIKKSVMVQGNKFSARNGELYSLRRRLLRLSLSSELILYGTDWNRGLKFDFTHWFSSFTKSRIFETNPKSLYGVGRNYPFYAGKVESKNSVLQKYMISIVIENSPDFISEKLFHSVGAGCVTIYVGPELEKYKIPKKAVISCEPNANAIIEKVRELLAKTSDELYEISQIQNKNLLKISAKWENSYVLRNLAINMMDHLKIDK